MDFNNKNWEIILPEISEEKLNFLTESLNNFDKTIDQELEEPLEEIRQKSKALANSLYRCFEQARLSERFIYAYRLGLHNMGTTASTLLADKDLLKEIDTVFEEADFMSFREFVRLLRACSLHIGGQTSAKIKEAYIQTFKEGRLILAYNLAKQINF